jgi:hypothetical protein
MWTRGLDSSGLVQGSVGVVSLKESHKMWGIFRSAEFFTRRVVDHVVGWLQEYWTVV